MKLLALDSSGLVASVAILDGETLVAEYTKDTLTNTFTYA